MSEQLFTPDALPPPEAASYMPPSGDWLIMTDTDPETIQMQMEAGILNAGSAFIFFNNCPDNFPGGRRRDPHLAIDYPKMFGDNYKRRDTTTWTEWHWRAHSKLMRDVKNGQFNDDIEAAMQAAAEDTTSGFDRERFDDLTKKRRAGKLHGPDLEAYSRSIGPVYLRLREAGYSHYDLIQ